MEKNKKNCENKFKVENKINLNSMVRKYSLRKSKA